MNTVAPELVIDEGELHETFVRSSGPGGQNVNKVATAVQLRFDIQNSPSLSDEVRDRLRSLAAGRVTSEGILVIHARRFRTQERNRQDARDRLAALVRRAAESPEARRPTRPSRASRQRRLDAKRRRGAQKRLREPDPESEA